MILFLILELEACCRYSLRRPPLNPIFKYLQKTLTDCVKDCFENGKGDDLNCNLDMKDELSVILADYCNDNCDLDCTW